jgi:hypothetical protein
MRGWRSARILILKSWVILLEKDWKDFRSEGLPFTNPSNRDSWFTLQLDEHWQTYFEILQDEQPKPPMELFLTHERVVAKIVVEIDNDGSAATEAAALSNRTEERNK